MVTYRGFSNLINSECYVIVQLECNSLKIRL